MPALQDILDGLAATLAGDPDVDAFCQANFGRGVTVFVGMDPADPPAVDDCPAIVIGTQERGRSADTHFYVHGIVVSCGVISEEMTTAGNIVKYAGSAMVNELATIIEHKASRYLQECNILVEQPAELPDATVFPAFMARWLYVVNIQDILGF